MNSPLPQSESVFVTHTPPEPAGGAGASFLPTPLARGPWHEGTQHGGPMLALLARAIEAHPSDRPMQVTRLTVDLMRSAPMDAVEARARIVRRGKNVEVLEASLESGGEEFARASAMRFRIEELATDPNPMEGDPPRLPDANPDSPWPPATREAFHHAQEMRPVIGAEIPALWLRLQKPLVDQQAPTPLERVAAAADSTYSVAFVARVVADRRTLSRQRVVSINPDTTINLHRQLRGEWVCLQGWTHQDPSGAGTAFVRIFDQEGPIGHASQSILIRGPEARPESWREFEKPHEKKPG